VAQKTFKRHRDDIEDRKAAKQARKMVMDKAAKRERRDQQEDLLLAGDIKAWRLGVYG